MIKLIALLDGKEVYSEFITEKSADNPFIMHGFRLNALKNVSKDRQNDVTIRAEKVDIFETFFAK